MILSIKIKPNSKTTQLLKDDTGNWILKVNAAPVDGKANEEVIRVLAKMLALPKSAIELISGHTNSHKRFHIAALQQEEVIALLQNCVMKKS